MLTVHGVNQQPAATAEAIDKALAAVNEGSGGSLFLGYSHPVNFVATRLAKAQQHASNEATNKLLGSWQAGINRALELQRKNRRKVRLVCLEDVSQYPGKAEKIIGKAVGQLPKAETVGDEWLLVADKAVEQDTKTSSLLQRLEACTQSISDDFYHPQINLQKIIKAKVHAHSLSKQIGQYQSENQLLQQQLNDAAVRASDMSKQLNQIQKQRDDAVAQAEGAGKQLEKENEQLAQQLHQVQEDLERYFIKFEDSKKELSQAVEKARETSKELEKVVKQRDEAKARVKELGTDLAERKAKAKNDREIAKEQKKQLQQQLFSTQNQLEQAINEQSKLEAKHKEAAQALETESSKHVGERDKLIKQLMKVQEQLKQAINDKKALQDAGKLSSQQENEVITLNRDLLNYQQRLILIEGRNSDLEQHVSELKTQLKNAELQADIKINHVPVVVETTNEKVINPRKIPFSRRVLRKLKLSGQKSSKQQQWLEESIERIAKSGFFDADWYLTEYPDLREAGVNPTEHYLRFGGFESRNPSPFFDSDYYIAQNDDVKNEGINPLLHFLLFGEEEGRLPKPERKPGGNQQGESE